MGIKTQNTSVGDIKVGILVEFVIIHRACVCVYIDWLSERRLAVREKT